jgi:hypothetical protein
MPRSSANAPQGAGRSATEGGDKRAGAGGETAASIPHRYPAANDATRNTHARQYVPAFVAGHDAQPIGERAAMRGHSAAEGGDEHGGVKGATAIAPPKFDTIAPRSARRDQGRARASMTYRPLLEARRPGAGRPFRIRTRPPSSPTTLRPSSPNAPQRPGATEAALMRVRTGASYRDGAGARRISCDCWPQARR